MEIKRAKCSNRKCGWIGLESEMRPVRLEENPRVTEMHCPRCDGNSFYYKLKPLEKERLKSGADLIALERHRQIRIEGYSAKHDSAHDSFELTKAAISYAQAVASPDEWAADHGTLPASTDDWPWAESDWKPSADPIRNLVKAGALIAAEIDRLQRLPAKP